tara:strand:- start:4062 stop:4208 length:147 start_codon:yes stop_codon:yes gene_type:complete
MAVSAYYGLSPDPELVEDVVEVTVEETLAPPSAPAPPTTEEDTPPEEE